MLKESIFLWREKKKDSDYVKLVPPINCESSIKSVNTFQPLLGSFFSVFAYANYWPQVPLLLSQKICLHDNNNNDTTSSMIFLHVNMGTRNDSRKTQYSPGNHQKRSFISSKLCGGKRHCFARQETWIQKITNMKCERTKVLVKY